jgi:uncharacterized membrane protein YphA (DoxX/SURF4 family)
MSVSSKSAPTHYLGTKLRRAPLRLATGAFILNAGLGKLRGDEQTAQRIHGMATGTYPVVAPIDPPKFLKLLGAGEVVVGSTLLSPFVPAGIAGLVLTGFSGALLNMYWRTPGMHEPNDPRPTPQGTAVAKDIWMLGIGLGLIIDSAVSRSHRNLHH